MGQPAPAYFRRNFVLGVVMGAFANVGIAFFDPATVLPAFITQLGGSPVLIGLVSGLHGVGWFFPQVFAARLASLRRTLIGMYRGAVGIRALAFFCAAIAVFSITPGNQGLFLSLFIILLFIAHFAGGIAAIPFLEITSRTIPVTSRGRFFGLRRLTGGLLGIVAGIVVGVILDASEERWSIGGPLIDLVVDGAHGLGLAGHTFPADFGVIFLLGAVFMTLGMFVFAFAGEIPTQRATRSDSMQSHIRSGLDLFRSDRHYRRFFIVRVCWQFTSMAFPFYVGYAIGDLGLPFHLVGFFLAIWIGSGVFSNYFWGRLLDTTGNRIVLFMTAALSVLPPIIILLLPSTAGPTKLVVVVVSATFLINGVVRSGRIISHITYLLELAPEGERPLYVGFMNSISAPFMLSPLVGGLIIEAFGARILFSTCLGFAVLNAVVSLTLREPRRT